MTLDAQIRQLVREELAAYRESFLARDLTLDEVAEVLQVSRRQVLRYINQPDPRTRLRAHDVSTGGERQAWRVSRDELERWKREARR